MTSAKNGGVQTPDPAPPTPLPEKIRNRPTSPPPCQKSDFDVYFKKKESTLLKKSYAYENYLHI